METARHQTNARATADGQALPVLRPYVRQDAFKEIAWIPRASATVLPDGKGTFAISPLAILPVIMVCAISVLCSSTHDGLKISYQFISPYQFIFNHSWRIQSTLMAWYL
jgi:hypothetical protein